MSMVAALDRIQQIQGTLSALNLNSGPAAAAPERSAAAGASAAGSPAAGSAPAAVAQAANASTFAEALSAVSGAASGGTGAPAGATGAPAGAAPVSGPAGPGADAAGGASGSTVEAAARKYLGLPYIWGGNDPAAGLDCSSFVQHVFRDLGYELPRTTWDQVNQGTAVASMAEARPGDLLFSFNTGHVSIYLGNGKAVDAPQPGATIQIRDAWENDSNVDAIRRILPAGSAFGTAVAAPQAAARAFLTAGAA